MSAAHSLEGPTHTPVLHLATAAPLPAPEPLGAEGVRLDLPRTHQHLWDLRGVEFEDGLTVRSYECTGCTDVLFR
ncbi:MAG: hypothetical protein JHD04_03905 [Nocardioides sp.]|nr:hypothetical protein [Nocardioides sp.]